MCGFKAEHSVLDKSHRVHHWERLTSPAVIFACNALSVDRTPQNFLPLMLRSMFIDNASVHACLCSHFKKLSHSRLPGVLAFIIFLPPFCSMIFPEPQTPEHLCRCIYLGCTRVIYCSLHFVQLWTSMMVSISCRVVRLLFVCFFVFNEGW